MKSCVVTIHEAKTKLSELIQRAAQGEDIVISRGSKPVARLVPIRERKGKRQPGSLKGRFVIGAEFFEPLPEDELSAWE